MSPSAHAVSDAAHGRGGSVRQGSSSQPLRSRAAAALLLRAGAALLLALGLACGSRTPAAGQGAAAGNAGAAPHRVILLSLDGAGSETLHDLHRRGLLQAEGFERFFREGEVAAALVPADPTLTSVNHVSLATGFPPAATGIVANLFHAAGAPATERANGFAAPIGTETLWEAARRQKRRVGVLTWPGADGKGERRSGDWGLVFNNAADREPQLLTVSRANWPRKSSGRAGTANPGAVLARVPLDAGESGGAASGRAAGAGAAARLDLVLGAAGYGAQGARGYTRLSVAGNPRGAAGQVAALLSPGQWGEVTWPRPGGRASSWVKLLELAPDLSRVRLYVGGVYHTLAYPPAFAAALEGSGLDWPGLPDDYDLAATWQGKPGIDLDTWTDQEARLAAFLGGALRLALRRGDWDLLLAYIPVIDSAGHRLLLADPRQAGFSPQRRDELARARLRVWQSVDTELRKLLAAVDLRRTTVVVVSDHGMAPVHTLIDPNAPLAGLGLLAGKARAGAATAPAAYAIGDAGVANVYLEGGDAGARARILADLARRYAAWRPAGEPALEKVFTRQEAARIGLDHPNSGDLVLFAREGYLFRNLPDGRAAAPAAPVYGGHGYLDTHSDMQASFLAIGAGVQPGQGGTLKATDVAPRVAAWLGIAPPRRQPPAPPALAPRRQPPAQRAGS